MLCLKIKPKWFEKPSFVETSDDKPLRVVCNMKNVFRILFVALGLFFCALMGMIIYPYLSFRYDVDFLLTKQTVLHILSWRVAFYTHITTSLFVLLIGIFQFVKPILIHQPRLHRLLGKIYIALTIFISAPSGLIMAFYANGGIWAKVSFVMVSVLWWYFTFRAYRKIRKGDVKAHLDNMYRSYALTFSAITLRLYVFFLPGFLNLHGKEMYTLVSWLSWVPNLIFAEILVRYSKSYKELLTGRSK